MSLYKGVSWIIRGTLFLRTYLWKPTYASSILMNLALNFLGMNSVAGCLKVLIPAFWSLYHTCMSQRKKNGDPSPISSIEKNDCPDTALFLPTIFNW